MGSNDEIIAISDDDDEIAILGSTRARSSSPVFIHASHTTTHVQLQAAPSGLFESPSSPVFVRASVSASISYVDVGNSDTEDDDSDEDDFAKVMAASIAQFERETQGVGIGSGSGVGSSLRIAEPVSRKGKGRAVECAASRGVSLARHSPYDILDEEIDEILAPGLSPACGPSPPKARPNKRKASAASIDDEDKEERARLKAAEKEDRAKARAAEKEADMEKRKLQREQAKADKEAEKSYQKKLGEVNRLRTSKIDALRDVEIHMAYDLSLPSSPIAGALPEIKQRVADSHSSIHFLTPDETVVQGTIRFLRHVRAEWNPQKKQYIPLDKERQEWDSATVLVASVDAIVDHIAEGGDALIEWLSDVRLTLSLKPSDQILLLVRGLDKYHSKTRSIHNRNFREAARAGMSAAEFGGAAVSGRIEKEDIEMELLRAQVVQRVFIVQVDKTDEIEDWLFNLAGDVAMRPYKLLTKSHLPFSAPDGGARKAAEPTEVLETMLQEIQGLTTSGANSIASEYPSFRHLMRAYDKAERRGQNPEDMLVGCEVSSLKNGAPNVNGRRIGSSLSNKVYTLMRGDDPLTLL